MKAEIEAIDSRCPYCGTDLEKIPKRKTTCRACKRPIFVRTRPRDRAKVLVTEEQVPEIERDWELYHGRKKLMEAYGEFYEEERRLLTEKFGGEPRIEDVFWSILNKERLKWSRESMWGMYRNTTLSMGDLLKLERRYRDALYYYLQVVYLDLNGPNNYGSDVDAEWGDEFPPFNPDPDGIAPGVLYYVKSMKDNLSLVEPELERIFAEAAEKQYRALSLPVSPGIALDQFRTALRDA